MADLPATANRKNTPKGQLKFNFYSQENGQYQTPPLAVRNDAVALPPSANARTAQLFDTDERHFHPVTGSWLTRWKDPAQTYPQWRQSFTYRVDPSVHTIVLVPVGDFAEAHSPSVAALDEFTRVYFDGMQAKLFVRVDCLHREFDLRFRMWGKNKTKLQILTSDVEDMLDELKRTLPNTFCVIGILEAGLWTGDNENIVYGEADDKRRVGVISLASLFKRAKHAPQATTPEEIQFIRKNTLLRRATFILSHEVGHCFGLGHCLYSQCAMNGSSHPLPLCPVCLRKLQAVLGFDVERRYLQLAKFCQKFPTAFETQIQWYAIRIRDLAIETSLLDQPNAVPAASRRTTIDAPLRLTITMKEKSGIVIIHRREVGVLLKAAKQKFRAKSRPASAFLTANLNAPLVDEDLLSLSDGVAVLVN